MDNNNERQPNEVTRRQFLKQIGVLFGTVLLPSLITGCRNNSSGSGKKAPDSPSPDVTVVVPTPESIAKNKIERSQTIEDKIRIDFNQDSLPFQYVDLETNEVIPFGEEKVAYFREARERAKQDQIPENVAIIPIELPISVPVTNYSDAPREESRRAEKPNDLLTEKELKERGITIIQTDEVQLYLRPGAFEKGQPLAAFTPDKSNKLIIALINGNIADNAYMENDSKYSEVMGYLRSHRDSLDQLRMVYIKGNSEMVERLRTNLVKAKKEGDVKGAKAASGGLTSYEIRLREINEIWDYDVLLNFARLSGFISYYDITAGYSESSENSGVVFMPVGKYQAGFNLVTINVTEKGDFEVGRVWEAFPSSFEDVYKISGAVGGDATPKMSGNLSENSCTGPGFWPFSSVKVRHELQHARSHLEKLNLDENQLQHEAFLGACAAWERYEASGYTDTSGYWVIWKTPEGWIYN